MYKYIPEIEKALNIIFRDKMVVDGYFDASRYIEQNDTKDFIYKQLKDLGSKYSVLFHPKSKFSKNPSEVENTWKNSMRLFKDNVIDLVGITLNYTEADAIVYWLLATYRSYHDRENFLMLLLKYYKSLYEISVASRIERRVVFNYEKIDLRFIEDISEYSKYLNILKDNQLYFRGHSNSNFELVPSIFRVKGWEKEEHKMFNEIIQQCPSHFNDCKSNFERLVEMQHFGIPTRLLDITSNPLVALYFSVVHNNDYHGEVVLLESYEPIYNADDDYVFVVSNLAKIKYEYKKQFVISHTPASVRGLYRDLSNEIRKDLSTFNEDIDNFDLKSYFYVNASMKNERIKNQEGAFILCGLISEDIKKHNLNHLRFSKDGKIQILLIDRSRKKEILNELDRVSVNEVKLFPGIESTSRYIREKYRRI